MSLREFEHVLDKLDADFLSYPNDKTITTELSSPAYKLTYPLSAREEQGGHVAVSCPLPPVALPVRGLAAFLEYLRKKTHDIVIEFNHKTKCFEVSTYLSPGLHEEELATFQAECDLVFPLLLEVGRQGIWNTAYIDLVTTPPKDLPQA